MSYDHPPKPKDPSELLDTVVLDLSVQDNGYEFDSSISRALSQAKLELQAIEETIESVKALRSECDRLDYALAASSGALCGIIDIFLVGKPGESLLADHSISWVLDRTTDFARRCGWEGDGENSAILFLLRKFKIHAYQRSQEDVSETNLGLTIEWQNIRKLGKSPTLLGLFFSIVYSLMDTARAETDDFTTTLEEILEENEYGVSGQDTGCRIFFAFVQWFGQMIIQKSSAVTDQRMGIPAPMWEWTKGIITIKNALGISDKMFISILQRLAVRIYRIGFDARFLATQAIPVFVNELVVRTLYALRRYFQYCMGVPEEERTFELIWQRCEPFSNGTVKRMLTVAHGTFCLLDLGDATIRGFASGMGTFNPQEFILRLNIIGVGRFAISLYGEGQRAICLYEAGLAEREKIIVENYIEGLNILAYRYDDRSLLDFVNDLQNSNAYEAAFEKTVKLAELRNVPPDRILRSKQDIDDYFRKRP